ncbi:MAG: NAD(P)-dependent oxidoreductase [Devosia sp.]
MSNPFRVGFIGIGIMGAPTVRCLRAKGWEVTVWNLEPERFAEVESSGAKWADSPAAARAASDVVMICVLGDHAIENVCVGEKGLVTSQGAGVIIDLSTTSPRMTKHLREMTNLEWLDAPVSGGPKAAEDGKLIMMAGGEPDLLRRLRPLLDDLTSNLTYMGASGQGQTAKILNQAIVGASYVVMAEVLSMSRAAGLDGDIIAQAFKTGAADSVILQTIYKQMVAADFEPPRSRAKQLSKDMHSVADFVHVHGLDTPLLELAIRQWAAYTDGGNGEADSASICRLYGQ